MDEGLKISMVIEMMGRPAEHLGKVMEALVKKVGEEEGVNVTKKKVHKPKKIEQKDKEGKPIKGAQDVFSTFSELDIETKTLLDLVRIVFRYMPSHVEITYPKSIEFKNFDLNTMLNELSRSLHQYDAIAKNALIQNKILSSKLQMLQGQGQDQVQQGQQRGIPIEFGVGGKSENKKTNSKAKKKKK